MTAAPSLSYASGSTPRPMGRRFVICLRITAIVFVLLAILVSWNMLSYFGVSYHSSRATRTSPRITTLEIEWSALYKAIPVFAILIGFAIAYFFLARRVNRGSENAIFAAAVMSTILTLVSALWLLTLFVGGTL